MSIAKAMGAGTKVLVTGGAGFVGSTLAAALLNRGCRVAVLDDLSHGESRNLPMDDPRLSFAALTVGNPAAADAVDDAVAVSDAVIHLASPIGVRRAHHERFAVTKNILDAGSMIVDACHRFRCPLLFMSSSEVYGTGHAGRITEQDPIVTDLRPRWGYAAAKAAVEHLAAGLFLEFGVPSWIVRPFNMAGARQKPDTGLVIASFAAAVLEGRPLVIHGDGSQTRAFLHVSDAAEALLGIMECPDLCGRPVNLGGNSALRINDLARLVMDVAGRSVPIIRKPPEEIFGEEFAISRDRVADTSLLTGMTGWRPLRPTEEAIADCIGHLRESCLPAAR
jgi:nucleoside-diphosphate-sugar epimerase